MDRKTTAAAVAMIAITFTLAMTAAAQLGVFGQDAPASAAPVVTAAASTAAGDTAASLLVAPQSAPVAIVSGPGAGGGGQRPSSAGSGLTGTGTTSPAPATDGATPTSATTAATTATTAPTTTAAATTAPPTTAGGRPTLYTVSGWLVPANYSVPSKWWTRSIPDFPLGTWAKCKLEDEGWACEH